MTFVKGLGPELSASGAGDDKVESRLGLRDSPRNAKETSFLVLWGSFPLAVEEVELRGRVEK